MFLWTESNITTALTYLQIAKGDIMEYKVILEPCVEDKGYITHCPALPGCFSQGDTKKEAIENIKEAIMAYLESLEKDNFPIPKDVKAEILPVKVPTYA